MVQKKPMSNRVNLHETWQKYDKQSKIKVQTFGGGYLRCSVDKAEKHVGKLVPGGCQLWQILVSDIGNVHIDSNVIEFSCVDFLMHNLITDR